MPGDRAAPVMPDDRRRIDPERIQQTDQIADEMELAVRLDLRRRVGLAVAPLIRSDDPIARVTKRLELMAPRIPALRKPVTQQHRRPVDRTGGGRMHAQPTDVDEEVLD